MKMTGGCCGLGCILAMVLIAVGDRAWAVPTTAAQAQQVVRNWLRLDMTPLDMLMGHTTVRGTMTYADDSGDALYHIVYLEEGGFCVVAGDDAITPIVAIVPDGEQYVDSTDNPLGALLRLELASRVRYARQVVGAGRARVGDAVRQQVSASRQLWQQLAMPVDAGVLTTGEGWVDEVRVPPLLATKWGQRYNNLTSCYNYYVFDALAVDYPVGCAATAMGQIIRYHRWPTAAIPDTRFRVAVDGAWREDIEPAGPGTTYDWDLMAEGGAAVLSLDNCQEIGKLLYNAGGSIEMRYAAGGSGAYAASAPGSFTGYFGYGNAMLAFSGTTSSIPGTTLEDILYPNLDAGLPVMLSIVTAPPNQQGHGVVADGYGYIGADRYTHINMGWSGMDDAWYNLPMIESTGYTFPYLIRTIYNIFPHKTGEIISGRVLDASGAPVEGVVVSGGGVGDTTDTNGIYALVGVASNTTHPVRATGNGFVFPTRNVAVTASSYHINLPSLISYSVGNRWGQDLVARSLAEAVDNPGLTFSTAGDSAWIVQDQTVFSGADAAQSGGLGNDQTSSLYTTVTGPGTVGFQWKISSQAGGYHDAVQFYIDGVLQESLAGEVDWNHLAFAITAAGSHSLEWRYVKDVQGSAGSDCAWVDQVSWTDQLSPITLTQAVDSSGLVFTSAGDGAWFGQADEYHAGGDAARSGHIEEGEHSSLATTVHGPGTVRFHWRVSSSTLDRLVFLVDGVALDQIAGEVDWQEQTFTLLTAGPHVLEWRYAKSPLYSMGQDCGWVDQVIWASTTLPELGTITAATGLNWSTASSSGATGSTWITQVSTSLSGQGAAQSGAIGDGAFTGLQTVVHGAGTIGFYWKVSSERGGDYLRFYIDGAEQRAISGEVDWQGVRYRIETKGQHLLQWVYEKNNSISEGLDAGWVEGVRWQADRSPWVLYLNAILTAVDQAGQGQQ